MELVKRVINDNEYTFVNKTWETSNSWGMKQHYLRDTMKQGTTKLDIIIGLGKVIDIGLV